MISGEMGNKTVIGNYKAYEDALAVANQLVEEGYSPEAVYLYADPGMVETIARSVSATGNPGTTFAVVPHDGACGEDDSFLVPFQGALKAGKIVVAVLNYRGVKQDTVAAATLEETRSCDGGFAENADDLLHTSPHIPVDPKDRANEI